MRDRHGSGVWAILAFLLTGVLMAAFFGGSIAIVTRVFMAATSAPALWYCLRRFDKPARDVGL